MARAATRRKAVSKPKTRNAKAMKPAQKASATGKGPTKKAVARSGPRRLTAAAARLAGGKPATQRFTVSHHREDDFKADGLRAYALYRDLGIAPATAGLCQAHVIRFLGPCTDDVRKRHYHETELQLVYVLKGWMKNEFEGHGEQLMQAGSCWVQPPGIRHTVLDYSDDCEVLEIIVPADFNTVELKT